MHFDMYLPNSYSTAAEVNLAYLKLASSNCLTLAYMKQPFLEYAACQWGHYARRQNNARVVEYFLELHQKAARQLPHIALETLFYSTRYNTELVIHWRGVSL